MSTIARVPAIRIKPSPTPTPAEHRNAQMQAPGFGRVFSDHMARIDWNPELGWHDARVIPYAPFSIDPANMTLHYGQAIFEGLKAYRQPDGSVALFRPKDNARRFNQSAERLAMPLLPEELFLAITQTLVDVDGAWVPDGVGRSLYLRPFAFATEAQLGVRPAHAYTFSLIASPVEPFFAAEPKPVKVWVSDTYVRAAVGGTGAAKCAGNYAAGLLAQRDASDNDCDQVLWLDPTERRYIEEMGGMNVFFVERTQTSLRLVTPPLTGTLLEGIVRNSIMVLARSEDIEVVERAIEIDELHEGQFEEAFACGTAAVVAPIGAVRDVCHVTSIGDGSAGPVTLALRQHLLDIQHGVRADRFGWMMPIAQ
jgi:branched-chain amino acid aminotransferase